MNRRIAIIFVISLLSAAGSSMIASAVSFYPPRLYHPEKRHEKFLKGDTVYLFHSSADFAGKTIHPGEIITVYRVSANCEIAPIGLIKVMEFVGDIYIKGEVFAGELRPDDLARKGEVSCLVISADVCDHKK